jgi:hypothetical protein
MYIIDCVELELYTNKFGDTKQKRNYIWGGGGTRTSKVECHWYELSRKKTERRKICKAMEDIGGHNP